MSDARFANLKKDLIVGCQISKLRHTTSPGGKTFSDSGSADKYKYREAFPETVGEKTPLG
jgi:hypothetical protein